MNRGYLNNLNLSGNKIISDVAIQYFWRRNYSMLPYVAVIAQLAGFVDVAEAVAIGPYGALGYALAAVAAEGICELG